MAEARAAVRDGDLDAVFVFPAGFAEDVAQRTPREPGRGRQRRCRHRDGRRQVGGDVVRRRPQRRAHRRRGPGARRPGLTPAEIEQVAEQTVHGAAPVGLQDTSATARLLDTKTYFAAGMAVFFLMFTVQFGVSSLIEERTEGTLPGSWRRR